MNWEIYTDYQHEMSCPSKRPFAVYDLNGSFVGPIKEYFFHFVFFPNSPSSNPKLWVHVAKAADCFGQQC